MIAAEQKARVTYDNILRLSDDPDVNDVIKFLRAREIVHFQRFGEAKRTRWRVTKRAAEQNSRKSSKNGGLRLFDSEIYGNGRTLSHGKVSPFPSMRPSAI